MAKVRIIEVEVRYVAKRGKDSAVREAVTDALDRLFEEQLGELVESASTTVRVVEVV